MIVRYLAPFFLALLFNNCTFSDANTNLENWSKRAENVEIIRDDFGVPHIYGKTDADAVFGLMYAQCEDDFRRVERNFQWAIGRLAESEGASELYSDLRANLFMTKPEAIEIYKSAPSWLQELCVAWAQGINYYLHTHPDVKPKVIKKYEPWMTMYFTEGSIGGDIERVSTSKLRDFYSGELANVTDSPLDIMTEPQGSNGIALAGKLTASGNTMLLINPHTSFYFRGEVHVVSEEGLNVYGAVTWGQFFVYQGFNEKTGWMHTSTYTDVIDEFEEIVIEKDNRLFYQYGDELKPVETQEVRLKYLDEGKIAEKKFTIYKTHHGPITHKIGDKWIATSLMWEPVKALTQSFIRTKQTNHQEFWDMMKMRTNASNNTVYADAEGNIAYYHGNFIPKRDIKFDYSKPVDGSNPATDWQGLHELNEIITIVNPEIGWIQNCNSTPFTAAAENSPSRSEYPYYMATAPENLRGQNAIRLLNNVSGFTLDSLISLAYNRELPAFKSLIPSLIDAYDNNPGAYGDAIDVLRKWDYKTDISSVAMTLAHYFGTHLYQNALVPDSLSYLEKFYFFGSSLTDEVLLDNFSDAMKELQQKFGTYMIPWGEVNRFQRLSGDIDASFNDSLPSVAIPWTTSRWGHLAAYGMRGKHDVNKIYGSRGNSFVAVVEFGDKVKAKTLLAGGQSSDPNSSHFNDQITMYANGNFKEAAFYRQEVDARAMERYHPGKRKDN